MTADVEMLPLPEVLALLDKASPGPWRWSMNGNIVPDLYSDDCEIAAVYSEHMDDISVPANAEAIIAAVNYLRAHGAKLAELQREIEALRAEVAEWKRVASAQAELHGEAEAGAERLAEALREMLLNAPGGHSCEEFHHHKFDRHMPGDDCPAQLRWVKAVSTAQAALLRDQEEGK